MANPIPMLKFQAFDSSGDPLSGGKLYTYDAGTTTPKTTYTDSTLGTPNTNPVILDSRGEANVWLSGGYKFVLKDSADATIYTVDNISDAFTNSTFSGTLTVTSTAVTWSGNPTHSGNHTFSGNTTFSGTVAMNGNNTIGNAAGDSHTINGTVAFNGSNVTLSAPASGYALGLPTKTPSSAADTGTTGNVSWDSSYIYICTGTNTWKRVAIATW